MKWLLVLLFFGFSPIWEPQDYKETSAHNFFMLAEVHEEIDFTSFDKSLMNAAIFYATNQYREKHRLPYFKYNSTLEKSSLLHSANMLKFNFFDHIDRKNTAYKTPLKRIEASGGKDFISISENLIYSNAYVLGKNGEFFERNGKLVDKKGNPLKAHTYASLARQMVANWHGSKSHRENLRGNYTFLGCGVSNIKTLKNGLKVVYATQNFGSKE